MGFRLRLVELSRGAVNVVLQPGHWEHPRVDHIGVALDDDGYTEALERAADLGLKIQDHPGKRHVHRHRGRLPARGAPAARLDRRARRPERRAAARRAPPARAGPGGEGGRARGDPRRRPARFRRLVGDTLVRFQDGGPEGRPGARRRGARCDVVRRGGGLAAPRQRRSSSGCAPRSSRPGRSGSRARSAAFAGLFALDDERLLAATTDGVGTKLILARRAGRLFDAGRRPGRPLRQRPRSRRGAEPLFFLDYAAAAALDLDEVAELVAGAASVCREAGCAILGGETAELPGIYREGELDFAGTMVGLVRRVDLVDGSRCEAGDAVLGLPSSGLHANGFTLVRGLLGDDDFDPDLLLPPTRLYLEDVRRLRAACDVRALAHVTGRRHPGEPRRASSPPGSARGSTPRPGSGRPSTRGWTSAACRGRAAARLQPRRRLLRGRARRRTPGAAACPVDRAPRGGDRRRRLGRRGVIGVLVSGRGSNLQALIDAGLPIAAVASNAAGAGALARAERAGIATAVFPLEELREPRGARPGHGGLARRTRGRARRLRRVHAPAHAGLPRALHGDQRPPLAPRRPSPGRRRSRTPSPPASPRPASPSTSSTRASTPAR